MPHDRAPGRRASSTTAAAAASLMALAVAACAAPSSHPSATPSRSITGSASPADPHILAVLQQSWLGYKQAFISADGRVSDPTRGGITTSEGQSYALLRAVWLDDRATFHTVWRWTAANLQTRGDGLFASLWGSGSVQDHNSATDADSDIALALLFASHRFSDAQYAQSAAQVLDGMWQHEVVAIDGMNVLTAGNWAAVQPSPGPVVNPSYLAPYAYRVFAFADRAHPWKSVVDSTYTVLNRCTAATLTGTVSAGLPPNWCALSRTTGEAVAFTQIAGANDYGYDAFRVMWRVAVDALWNGEQRARDYLARSDFLRHRWASAEHLDPVYGHDGTVVAGYDDPTVYGGDLGNFLVADPGTARAITARLMATFDPGPPAHFGQSTNYYEQNWVWFGLALAGGALTNLMGG